MDRGKKKLLLTLELLLLAVLAPSPALRFDNEIVTAYGLCTAAAALLAVILFERLRLREIERPKDGPVGVIFRVDALELALCVNPAALLGARIFYCVMRPGYYLFDMGVLNMFCLWEGGFLLYGAVFGAVFAAAMLAKKRKMSVLALLDQMTVPGLVMIAICRLAEGFAGEGLGAWIEQEVFARFPIAVQNPYGEWQLAVFLFEACYAALIIVPVLRAKGNKGKKTMLALALYAGAQIVFESLRMDSCLRIGFVRVSQVISALVLLAVTAWIQKNAAGKRAVLGRCAVTLICVACIGAIEWALDKTQVDNLLLYIVMAALCALMAANALCIKRKDKKA